MWDVLDRFDWLTVLDCDDIEQVCRAHGPPWRNVAGDVHIDGYASDADARTAALAMLEGIAVVLQRHGERDPREVMDAARHFHDKVIMTVDQGRPRDTWIDRGGFTAALDQALAEKSWWMFAAPAKRGPASRTRRQLHPVTLRQATWLQAQLDDTGHATATLLKTFGDDDDGPSWATIEKILKGEGRVTLTTWKKIVKALNALIKQRTGRKIALTIADVPDLT